MATLTKIIVSTIIAILMLSCEFDLNINSGVKGNGNVTKTERTIESGFNEIKISRGLEVFLTQSANESIIVEADENLQDIIITEIEDNVLKIYADKNISNTASKKVFVTFKDVSSIKATSGSNVISNSIILTNTLDLTTTSGSEMALEVQVENLICNTTSGSNLNLSGNAKTLTIDATSGSNLKADNLEAITSRVKATSGAAVKVNTSRELTAKATSGGDITYYGNPEKVEKSDGVSGSIKQK